MTVHRIDTLTDAQHARMDGWADEWIARGLDCTPADRTLVEDGIRRCYEHAGLAWHGNVVWVGSPIVGAFAAPIARHVRDRGGAVGDAVGDVVGDAVRVAVDVAVDDAVRGAVRVAVGGAVRGAVGGAVDDAVDYAVRVAVDDAVRGAVRVAVDDAVRDAVGGAVDDAVGGAVGGAVDDAVGGAVRGAVDDAVRVAVDDAVDDGWWRWCGGQWWVSWQAWTTFFRDVCHLDLDGDLWDRDRAYADAQSAGWWWPHTDFCLVVERPEIIRLEQVGPRGWGSHRLHCADGPAIRWRDGWAIHAWHGVRVPADLIEAGWSVEQIAAEANTEIRRCAIERYGWGQYLADLGAVPVDECDDPGNVGQRLRLYDLPEHAQVYGERARLLVMANASLDRDGTRRMFAEPVDAGINDALAAAAWQFGADRDVYAQIARAT